MARALPPPGPALDRWILERRGPRNSLDPERAYAAFVEPERASSGQMVDIATILLTNRECPYRCLMCDLWVNTLTRTVPSGAIPRQIGAALATLPAARQIKLYNAGSFFDKKAIPPADHEAIARLVSGFERVIVECHPALVSDRCAAFRDLLGGSLEVAMGLETIHPDVLPRLNKRMTADDFARASGQLVDMGIPVRAFVLLRPPFLDELEGIDWAVRSVAFAFEAGVDCCTIIPSRPGNGAMDDLAQTGDFTPPGLAALEQALDRALPLTHTPGRVDPHRRVFADTWDLAALAACPECAPARRTRITLANRTQAIAPEIACRNCTVVGLDS